MNRTQFQIVRELFHELSEVPPRDRASLLSERELDPEVRDEVQALLKAASDTDVFEEDRLGSLGSALVSRKLDHYGAEDPLPETIGPYRVLRKLGAGGMGLVFAARREDTGTLAAVKVIRPTIDSSSFLKRFRREVRNLRSLDHRGIAAFLEEGTAVIDTATGRASLPFLAMELIEGLPLCRYAAQHDLGDRERVALVAKVCEALQHAHERQIVHRDLKPNNILVVGSPGPDGVGEPKLLDFGIARAVDVEAHTMTVTTAGILMGTLPYMSPEQVRADREAIDARSDVYSLGVILYELLAGRLPYPVGNQSIPEATRTILEEEPTRLGSLAPRLRGDLEVIVSRALEKDPRHRYPSAAALAEDLHHFLGGRPILARSPRLLTRALRFTRRNRALTAVALTIFTSLVAALIVAAYFGAAANRRAEERLSMVYRTSMRAAGLAHSIGDLVEVRRHLQDAPESLRDWEWQLVDASLNDGVLLGELALESGQVSMAFPNSGSRLTLFHRDRAATQSSTYVVDTASGSIVSAKEAHVPGPKALSPDGQWTAWIDAGGELFRKSLREGASRIGFGLQDERIRLVGVSNSGDVLARLPGCTRHIAVDAEGAVQSTDLPLAHSLSLSADGRRVAWCHAGVLGHWDAERGERVSDQPTVPGLPALGPDPKWVCLIPTSGAEPEVWRDDGQGALTLDHRLLGHSRKVMAVAFAPDGRRIATAGVDQSIRIWDLPSGELLATRVGHTDSVESLVFSPDGRHLVSYGADATLREWTADSDPRVLSHGSYVYGARFSPDGSRVYTASWDTYLRAFDTASGVEVAKWHGDQRIRGLAVAFDGSWVAAANPSAILVVETTEGRELADVETNAARILSLAASPTEDALAVLTGSEDELLLVQPRTGTCIVRRPLPMERSVAQLAFSPDGKQLAVCLAEQGCLILDARTLETLREIPVVAARCLAYSPDGRELAVGTYEADIHLIPLEGRGAPTLLEGHTSIVHSLCYTPDGRRLVSGSGDHTLGIWNPVEGELIARLWGHEDYVYDLDISPDGGRIVTASGDATARIWEPFPLARRLEAAEERQARIQRLEPIVRGWLEAGGPKPVPDRLEEEADRRGWDGRDQELARQLLLHWSLSD